MYARNPATHAKFFLITFLQLIHKSLYLMTTYVTSYNITYHKSISYILDLQLMLWEITGEMKYKEAVESFLKYRYPGGEAPYTPCGLNWLGKWGSARSAGTICL